MRKRITLEMIKACYAAAKSIYPDGWERNSQAYWVSSETGMDERSAWYYIDDFFRMREGRRFIPISAEGTEYYLSRMFVDYGTDGLINALDSVQGYLKNDLPKIHFKLQGVVNEFKSKAEKDVMLKKGKEEKSEHKAEDVGNELKQKRPILHKKGKQYKNGQDEIVQCSKY